MDDTIEEQARRAATHFLEEEQEFHLGALPTEQAHPKTRELSQATQRDTAEGVALLLGVDHDLAPKAAEVFESTEFRLLVAAIIGTVEKGGIVAFSGCGATGRLAIILEKIWRSYWAERALAEPAHRDRWKAVGENSYSIMTGGDRALIRSVENFEDFAPFGRRQVADAGLGPTDLLVAVSEGGETSSVIGTAWEALDRGARVFFVYNNPSAVLARTVKRSREVLENPEITKLDLATGPMALSGSTRLQATTMEMLVVGAAMEIACQEIAAIGAASAPERTLEAAIAEAGPVYAREFDRLVSALGQGDALTGIAAFVDLESGLYAKGGLVTYLSDEYLLDIISDTTERTPTFMLPPFRPQGDTTSAVSWAFTKDPLRDSDTAWQTMLGREPRGIDWTAEDYRTMGGLDRMISSPPKLDAEEIYSYRIGRERDASRFDAPDSVLLLVSLDSSTPAEIEDYLEVNGPDYHRVCRVFIGAEEWPGRPSQAPTHPDSHSSPETTRIHIPVALPSGPLDLFSHLALKLVLNTVSTATMAKLGRIQGNWMIQVDATNKKLIDRATRIVSDLAGLSYEDACLELHRTIARRLSESVRSSDSTVIETLKHLGKM